MTDKTSQKAKKENEHIWVALLDHVALSNFVVAGPEGWRGAVIKTEICLQPYQIL